MTAVEGNDLTRKNNTDDDADGVGVNSGGGGSGNVAQSTTATAAAAAHPASSQSQDVVPVPDVQLPRISLVDVQNAVPRETLDERTVMAHIERTDAGRDDVEYDNDEDGDDHHYTGLNLPDRNLEHEISFVEQATALNPEFMEAVQQQSKHDDRHQRKNDHDDNDNLSLPRHNNDVPSSPRNVDTTVSTPKQQQQQPLQSQRTLRKMTSQSGRSQRKVSTKISIEEELFELTNFLDPLQFSDETKKESDRSGGGGHSQNTTTVGDAGTAGDDATPADDDGGLDDHDEMSPLHPSQPEPTTQTQAFGANAARMFANVKGGVQRNVNRLGNDALRANHRLSSQLHSVQDRFNDGSGTSHQANTAQQQLHQGEESHERMEVLREVHRIIKRNRHGAWAYFRRILCWLILPCLGIALLLYYALGNPNGRVKAGGGNNSSDSDKYPTYSWLFLFFGVRQVLTFALAVAIQVRDKKSRRNSMCTDCCCPPDLSPKKMT